ncbi:MAG: hypothetical protein QME68_00545 [Elusimicrobiota bacterium]|nr:hypothetical protein [Elusimicrobiota bacterium]
MKKLITTICILFLAGTTYAYVALSNRQLGLGSYRLDATNIFYDELDIISAYPVSLMEFEGNRLYTNWGNVRQPVTGAGTYNPVLSHRGMTLAPADHAFTIGVSGNPLGYFNIENSRSGLIFQNWGAKTNTFDFDGVPGNDSEYTREFVNEIITSSTNPTIMRRMTESTDVKYWTNTTVTQWNIGIAKKGLPILTNLSVGLSLANNSYSRILTAGGSKSYTDRYLTDDGAADGGMPAGSREGDTYNVTYADNKIDQNSFARTDVLGQLRYELLESLTVDCALGARFQTNNNPGGLINPMTGIPQGSLEKDIVTVTMKDDVNWTNIQYYNIGTAIRNRILIDYNVHPTYDNVKLGGANHIWDKTVRTPGTSDFKDNRFGIGPLVRLQGEYKGNKVNLTGVLNFDTVSQNINANQTLRDYIKIEVQVSSYQRTSEVGIDATATNKYEGTATNSNFDLGIKVEFKALENIKLALGGFIMMNTDLNDFTKIETNYTNKTSYDDGLPENNPGEFTQTETRNDSRTGKNETVTMKYYVPIGVEIPLSKKWTFRAGTSYIMTKTQRTVTTKQNYSISTTVHTPAGGSPTTTYTENYDPLETKTVTYAETHTVSYSYGIQWDINKNLTVACNAFLDTNPNTGDNKATIFDLDTYRLLAVQAIFKF